MSLQLALVCSHLLIFITIITHFHTDIDAYTHKHTCMISAQKKGRETGTGAWLGGTEKDVFVVEDKGLAHTHTHTK